MTRISQAIYFLVFVFVIITPHLITDDLGFFSEAQAESLLTFLFICIGVLFYYLYQRDLRKKELEKKKLENQLDISSQKLNEAFEYIGQVNRRLPLLKSLTTDLLVHVDNNKKSKKNIFEILLATSVNSITKSDWGMFRFVDILSGNTVKEFVFTSKGYVLLKQEMPNQILLAVSDSVKSNSPIKQFKDLFYIGTKDKLSQIKCYYVCSQPEGDLSNSFSVLQSIVDQAQLFYHYLFIEEK